MRRISICGAVGAAVVGMAGFRAGAEEVTLGSVADTSIWELDPEYNFGRQRSLPAGAIGDMVPADGERARALYKFDVLGAVPPGMVIEAARMTLAVTTNRPGNRGISDFALSRVLVDWGEGDNLGEFPGGREADDPGEATWNNRFHPADGWSIPGGAFGVDFAAEQSALVPNVDSSQSVPRRFIFDFNATGLADLRAMIDGTLPNYGWVLFATDEETLRTARHWTSRESRAEIEGPPPELEITFSLPPPVLTGVDIDSASSELVVRVAGRAGLRYQLECGDDLVNWTPGEEQTPAADAEIEFRVPMSGPRKFVRVAASVAGG